MIDDSTLGLGYYMPPNGGPAWTPVGTGSAFFDPMLQYFHDIAYSLIELRANIQKDSPPVAYRKKTSQPFKCRIGDKSFTFATKAVSDKARKSLRNKAIVNGSFDIEEIVDGPFNRLQNHPNNRQSWGEIFYDAERMKCIWGSAFLFFEQAETRLWTIPFNRNNKATYDENGMDVLKYHLNGKDYTPDQIIAFVCANPANSYRIEHPISPLFASCKALRLNEMYFNFVARTFANGANPTMALKSLKGMSEDNHKTIATDLKNNLTGQDDGALPVYDGSAFELQQFPVPYKDIIGNVEQQKLIRLTCCNAFQVPNGIFDATAASRAALDATLLQLYDMLSPMISSRDEKLTHFFRELYQDESIFFATPDPRPVDDDKIRADMQLLLTTGSIKKNEGRKVYDHYDLPQLPEFEETATKPAPQLPAMFEDATADGDTVENPVPSTAPGAAPVEEAKDKINMYQIIALQKEVYGGTISRDAAIGQLTILFGFSDDEANKLIPEQQTVLPTVVAPEEPVKAKAKKTATRDDLEHILAKYFRKQGLAVIKKLTGNEKAVRKAIEKGESGFWKVKADVSDVEHFFDMKMWNKELFDDVYPTLSLIYEELAEMKLMSFNLDADMFGMYSHELKPVIRARVLSFCDETNKTTLLQINDAYAATKEKLEAGATEGVRLEELTRSIGEVYANASDSRVYRIANTENAIARTMSSKFAAEKAGVKGMKNLPSLDACPECQGVAKQAGDKFYPLDHKFGGSAYTHYQAPYHPHCRCDYLYQTEGDE